MKSAPSCWALPVLLVLICLFFSAWVGPGLRDVYGARETATSPAVEPTNDPVTSPAAEATQVDWAHSQRRCPPPLVTCTGRQFLKKYVPSGAHLFYIRQTLDTYSPEHRCMTGPCELRLVDMYTGEDRLLASSTFPLGTLDVPRADGDWVVWLDWAELGPGYGRWKVFALNAATGEQLLLGSSAEPGFEPHPEYGEPNLPMPDIHSGRVVWSHGRPGVGDVYVYDLNTRERRRITDSGDAFFPQVWGDNIVYVRWDQDNGTTDVMLHGIEAGTDRPLLQNVKVWNFSLWGNRLAYSQKTPVNDHHCGILYLLHLVTGERRLIGRRTPLGYSYMPALGDGFLAWHMTRTNHINVFDYNNPEKSFTIEAPLPQAEGVGISHPVAHGDTLAWRGRQRVDDDLVETAYVLRVATE